MKSKTRNFLLRLPGWTASVLMILIVYFWSFWGGAEMYHEGWWGAWYNRLPYLAPIFLTLIPTLIAFRFPLPGGLMIFLIGLGTFFFFGFSVSILGLGIALIGLAFMGDGWIIKKIFPRNEKTLKSTWRQNWRELLVLGGTSLILLGVSAVNLPIVLTRLDDGDRSASRITGNEVDLIWAPEGPGWNWKQSWGGYPSWQDLALYGISPIGFEDKIGYDSGLEPFEENNFAGELEMNQFNICLYLSEDGGRLLTERQNIWRMPTTDEFVRSLVRHGSNAGCVWKGEFRKQVNCEITPDKESPLWSTDVPVVYYWTADEYDGSLGYFVSYNGMVNATYKTSGNPRHGYRCVKEP